MWPRPDVIKNVMLRVTFNIEEGQSDLSLFINYNSWKISICDPLCQSAIIQYIFCPLTKWWALIVKWRRGPSCSTDSKYLCSTTPFLTCSVFPMLVLGRMSDVPPCCALGGRKRGLRRKLCRSFSFWSFSHPSTRSFALGSSFHFGLGLIWFNLWNIQTDLSDEL